MVPLSYPPFPTVDHTDNYHGTIVPDPYRPLEDPQSEDTQAWIEAQNALTDGFLKDCPSRGALADRLRELWNYERYSIPVARTLESGTRRYFYLKNNGLQNQSILYCQDGLGGEPQVILDPNTLSADGTVALRSWTVSDNGQWMAYALSEAGSDWQTWRVRNIQSGEDLDSGDASFSTDYLQWSKFSRATWTKDNQGFFYSAYAAPKPGEELEGVNYFQKLFYHRLGTPQQDDRLIYERSDQKEWGFDGDVSTDGRYLVISVWQGTDSRNLVFYQDLQAAAAPIVELIPTFEAGFRFLANQGSRFWFWTDWEAPKGRVIEIDLTTGDDRSTWQTVIPETQDTLEQVTLIGGQWFATYLKDAASQVQRYDLTGNPLGTIDLPGLGSVSGLGGKPSDQETFYSFTSFTVPPSIYRYDCQSHTSHLFRSPQVPFAAQDYETHQVFATSADGTQVPLFITHRKGLERTGNHPTYLYGYGGFNVSLTPNFSTSLLVWLELGGIYVQAVLRGGGEYGQSWHEAGMKHRKQNVFDDFIGAADYLIQQGYTQPKKLAIAGGSNGGLLVGACLVQRPDLFGAALPAVGVLDMLRFHQFTIGWAWCPEYGCADNPEDFPILYGYSPLHNLQPGTHYPATLVSTADHDDRVVPAHSFKFTAALQAAQGGPAPILIRIETKAGHGAGKPVAKLIEEQADKWAFLIQVLEITPG